MIDGLGSKATTTTILILADNGTPSNLLQPPYVGGSVQNGGHGKGSIFEQGIRVPFIAGGYMVADQGVHEGVVSTADIWRTVADLAGASPGIGGDDSVSLYDILQNPQLMPPRMVFSQIFRPNGLYDFVPPQDSLPLPQVNVRAMIGMEFKFIRATYNTPGQPSIVQEGAFHLVDSSLDPLDPAECNPLPVSFDPEIQALKNAMIALCGDL